MIKIAYITITLVFFISNYLISTNSSYIDKSIYADRNIQVFISNTILFLYFTALYFFSYWLFLVLTNKKNIEQKKKWKNIITISFIYLVLLFIGLSIIQFLFTETIW